MVSWNRPNQIHDSDRVSLPLVLVAVVENGVSASNLVRKPYQVAGEGSELGLGVFVVEALGWRICRRVVGLLIATVEPQQGVVWVILPPYFRTRAIRNVAPARSEQSAERRLDAA